MSSKYEYKSRGSTNTTIMSHEHLISTYAYPSFLQNVHSPVHNPVLTILNRTVLPGTRVPVEYVPVGMEEVKSLTVYRYAKVPGYLFVTLEACDEESARQQRRNRRARALTDGQIQRLNLLSPPPATGCLFRHVRRS